VICSGATRERVVYTSQTNEIDVRTFATVVVAETSRSAAADGPRFIIRYDGKTQSHSFGSIRGSSSNVVVAVWLHGMLGLFDMRLSGTL